MKERLNSLSAGEALETIRITVPQGATNVNLQMNMAPENYFWGNNNQGTDFRIEGATGARRRPPTSPAGLVGLFFRSSAPS
jgi:hypothetical protein